MNIKSKIGTMALAALLVVAGLSLAGCGKEVKVVPEMPPKLENRVEFHLSATKEKEEIDRLVHYSPDGTVKIGVTIEYKSGNTAKVVYRTSGNAAGTIESVKIEYPLQSGQKKRQTARELMLDLDGKTAITDRVYRENGLLRYTADLRSDTKFEAVEFQDNGTSTLRHQAFLKLYGVWKLDSEETYRQDGGLETSFSRLDDGSAITKKFTPDNKVEWRSVLDSWGGNRVTDYYEADGTTTAKRVSQSTYDVTTTQFKQGKPTQETRFQYSYTSIAITFYDDNGKARLIQTWSAKAYGDVRTNGQIDTAKYKLNELEYKNVTGIVTKDVVFYPDGKTPQTIRLRDPSKGGSYYNYPFTLKKFRDDGTLSEVSEQSGYGSANVTETHTAAENIRETFDPNDLAMPAVEQPPEFIKYQYRSYYNY